MAAVPPICDFGWKAREFTLMGTDGEMHTLSELKGERGTLIVFKCNHCPYVKAILDRLVRDARELQAYGVNTIAISSNDPETYPEDSFDTMKRVAQAKDFPFPYLYDETQEVARAYEAVCTPDFFGFNASLELQYRGRLDESKTAPVPGAERELFNAMVKVAESGEGPREQVPSMGCTIKWRAA